MSFLSLRETAALLPICAAINLLTGPAHAQTPEAVDDHASTPSAAPLETRGG